LIKYVEENHRMRTANILVIEDDRYVARTIERCLRGDQYRVAMASNGADGLQMAIENPPDLVILDIIMRGMDGYAVCRAMRAETALQDTPVLFLTAKVKPEDKLAGFRVGADDYLCKPFNVDELLLRVQAILRRTLSPERPPDPAPSQARAAELTPPLSVHLAAHPELLHRSLVIGDFVLDTQTYELQTPARGRVRLTPLQYDLLYHLMTHPGETFSPARLLNEVWDYPIGRGSPDLVRVHIKTLRERIETEPQDPSFLRTVSGKGYAIGDKLK
jgi:DNA-binding response OmpR family regulator